MGLNDIGELVRKIGPKAAVLGTTLYAVTPAAVQASSDTSTYGNLPPLSQGTLIRDFHADVDKAVPGNETRIENYAFAPSTGVKTIARLSHQGTPYAWLVVSTGGQKYTLSDANRDGVMDTRNPAGYKVTVPRDILASR